MQRFCPRPDIVNGIDGFICAENCTSLRWNSAFLISSKFLNVFVYLISGFWRHSRDVSCQVRTVALTNNTLSTTRPIGGAVLV